MALDTRPPVVTAAEYAEIFDRERAHTYPAVDALEQRLGVALDRTKLEAAARVLSCPFKAAPPNWQHGRVIYAVARAYLTRMEPIGFVPLLDIGTAKGFSALCLHWALTDSGRIGQVTSVDVMPPDARVRRNTPAEVDGLKTLAEILAPWPEAEQIHFAQSTGIDELRRSDHRIVVAFIDGKHSTEAVSQEWRLLADRQAQGDVAIFDDVQMPPVKLGLKGARAAYSFEMLELGHVNRAYAIGVRQ